MDEYILHFEIANFYLSLIVINFFEIFSKFI